MKRGIVLIVLISLLSLSTLVFSIEGNTWVAETDTTIFKGWNLVYSFIHPNQLEDQILEGSHIKAVYAFIPNTQEYARVYPNPEEDKLGAIDDDELMQTAFFVYSDSEAKTEYWIDNEVVPLNQRQIYKGWNFVGITSDMLGNGGVPELKDLLKPCNVEKAYFFNPEQQEWGMFPLDEDFSRDALNNGIVIKVSEDCKPSSVSGDSVSPPSIPN